MHVLPGFDDECLINVGVMVGCVQVVVGAHPDLAIAGDGAMFFRLQHRNAVALDGFPAVVTHFQSAVVADLLFHIPLGAQVDQLLPGAVFDRQFVIATVMR
ncbi:hypothetical protein D3C85_1008570 [compost metagenome]